MKNADVDGLRFFRFAPGRHQRHGGVSSRTGYTGELGYELYMPAEEPAFFGNNIRPGANPSACGPTAWSQCKACASRRASPLRARYTARKIDALPRRTRSLDSLRQARLPRPGGAAAGARTGLRAGWVGLALESDIPANHGAHLHRRRHRQVQGAHEESGSEAGELHEARDHAGETQIGSRHLQRPGHSVGKTLALAYVRITHAWPGGRRVVVISGRPIAATVAPTPFFDPEGMRVRADGAAGWTGGPRDGAVDDVRPGRCSKALRTGTADRNELSVLPIAITPS